jgi:fido (protein-threonine AMPylation protein)
LKQRAAELEKLMEIAKVRSTEASNAIEGIVTTNTRIRQLVEEKTTPRNRDEQEIVGYRDALNIIYENFDTIPVTRIYILQLHKILYSHMSNPLAGQTKNVQNYISASYPDGHTKILFTPLAPYETPGALDKICKEYNKVMGNFELEPLIAIPVFIHDFLCIHPFNDGNGRISRLLTTLLLYRSGFEVGKYISLEAKIAKNKDLYYNALNQAQNGWNDGTEDKIPFIKYRKLFKRSYCTDYLDYVCVDEMGKLFRPNYVTDHFKLLLQRNGLRQIRFHDLRHSCASLLLSPGIAMKQIQDWLGHSTFATTADIYSHLDFNSKQESAAAITHAFEVEQAEEVLEEEVQEETFGQGFSMTMGM